MSAKSIEQITSDIVDAILEKRHEGVAREKITVIISRGLSVELKASYCHWHLDTSPGETQPNRFQGLRLRINDDEKLWSVVSN